MKFLISILVIGLSLNCLAAKTEVTTSKAGTSEKTKATKVLIETNKGNIEITLDMIKAKKSSENFINYVKSDFYNDTIFHRVIDGFMIQGGGFTKDLSKKTTKAPIKNEADNGLKNSNYTVAMARTNDPHSATAQFFINVKDNNFLNHSSKTTRGWGYAVFGKVTKGENVVNIIKRMKTKASGMMKNLPVETVSIKKASIIK